MRVRWFPPSAAGFLFAAVALAGCGQRESGTSGTGGSGADASGAETEHGAARAGQAVFAARTAPDGAIDVARLRETLRRDEAALGLEGNPRDLAAEKNDAANRLFSLPRLPAGVVDDLAEMAADESRDPVWRDYCLQFLGEAVRRHVEGVPGGGGTVPFVSAEDAATALAALERALASRESTLAGTALRALQLAGAEGVPDRALSLAADELQSPASRTVALLILSETRPCEAVRLAAEIIRSPSSPSFLRQTAASLLPRPAAR